MQIAKLFAGLGFQVDTTGLVVFKKAIADARSEMTNITRGSKNATRQFRSLRRETDKLSASMGKIKNAGGNRQVGGSYRQLAGDVYKVRNALDSISVNQPRTTKAIGKINASVIAGTPHWNAYRRSIVQTRRTLQNLNGDLNRLRANSRIDVRIRNTGGGQGGGSGGAGAAGGLGGALFGAGGIKSFLSNIVPAMALGSVGAGVGYGGVAMVKAAREQTSMESMILMISDSAAEYKSTVDYVNNESRRLGLNAAELGKSFAQVSMSAENLSGTQKKEMFTGFSEFMMSMGTNADDQKGIFRAFNQMFSNNRLLQEEINQLSDRGIPATLVYDAAMKAYGLDTVAQVKKLQEAGKLDPSKVLPIMAKTLQDKARDTGAFDKMQQSSMFKQNQFMSELRLNSKAIMDGGLDEMLGALFGQLTELVVSLSEVARGLQEVGKGLSSIKSSADEVTSGNGLLLMSLSLLLFRWKAVTLGARRALIVLRNNGAATRALGELFKGVFGQSLKLIIQRFGGWITVIYGAYKGLQLIGRELKQKDLGNWTIFDTISLRAEYTVVQVKKLIAELKWLSAYVSSGAILDESMTDIRQAAGNRFKNDFSNILAPSIGMGVTQVLRGKAAFDKIINRESSAIKSISEYENKVSPKLVAGGSTINIYSNKTGELVETHKVPPTYNQ